MKKKIGIGIFVLTVLFASGCGNKELGWGNYEYHYMTCDGVIKMENAPVRKWQDFDGEQLEVKMEDGNTYLVNSINCVLTEKEIPQELLK